MAARSKPATRIVSPETMIGDLRNKGVSWEEITYKVNEHFGLFYTRGTIIAIAHRHGILTTPPQREGTYEKYAYPQRPGGVVEELDDLYTRLTSYKELANYVSIKTKQEVVQIFAVGDIHLGHCLCDFERVKKYLDYIENTEGTYCFLMGDLMECAQKNSIGNGKDEEILNVDQQWDLTIRILKPLVKKNKILWGHIGNHEGRVLKNASFDMQKKLFNDVLGVPYLDFEGFTVLRVNEIDYTFYTHHGWGASRSKAAKIRKIEELTLWNEADIYGMGHTHELHQSFSNMRYVDKGTMEISTRKRPLLLTGAFLKYGGYIAAKAFPPSTIGCPNIQLDARRFKTYVRE